MASCMSPLGVAQFGERLACVLIIDDLSIKAAEDGFWRSTVNVLSFDVKMTDTGVSPLVVAVLVVCVILSDNATTAVNTK